MTEVGKVEENIRLVRVLSNDLASFLHSLPDDVWRDAETYASACDRWNMADVVAHLISVAHTLAMSVERAVKGSVAPPMGYRRQTSDERVESVVSLREAFDEDLFPEFNASCLRINRLLVGLEPETYFLPAWRPNAVLDVSRLIELRAMELAVHGWDVRYGIDRGASINPQAVPFLKGWVRNWLRAGFRPPTGLDTSVRLRFSLTDTDGEARDLLVENTGFSLEAAGSSQPDVVLSLDTSSYILFLMGRLPVRRSVRRGRIGLEGDANLAESFGEWFVGV